jgi:restriction endonuclease S subunit
VARPGDILFARIEPSIFNKKYIWLGDIGEPEIYTSGEFHILTPKVDLVSNSYLYACLFSATVFSQVQGKTTGSSGRRRLHSSLLETVQVPLPARTTQEELGRNVLLAQQRARDLRERARIEWDAAKLDMELQLFEEKL